MIKQAERPNIFKISNKELSQDAFITWLLQWANPQCAQLDAVLHECGKCFLTLVTGGTLKSTERIQSIDAGRQWENIDIWAQIFFADGRKTLIIVEDKTFTGAYEGQLEKYKKQAEAYCTENNFNQLICTYYKIGSDPLNSLQNIREKGFHIVTRREIIACLEAFRDSKHSILTDYISYVEELEAAHVAYEKLVPKEWTGKAWVGFFQYVETQMKINTWHRVNNPGGGFWNLCLTWEYWNHIPVYMQIEEHKLCYKIGFDISETGEEIGEAERYRLQDYAWSALEAFTKDKGVSNIRRPHPFVHKGNYRTFAVIDLPNWYGNPDQTCNKQEVITRLQTIVTFYHKFIEEINGTTIEEVLSVISQDDNSKFNR